MRHTAVGLLFYLCAAFSMAADVSVKPARELKGILAISPDFSVGVQKVTKGKGFNDYALKILDLASGKEIRTLDWDSDWGNPHSPSFSPDGKRLAVVAGSTQKGVTGKVYDLTNGELLLTIRHDLDLQRMVFSPDGKSLASIGGLTADPEAVKLWLWNLETGKKWVAESFKPYCVAFSPDGKHVITGHSKGMFKGNMLTLCDTTTGKRVASFGDHEKDVTALAFSPDGKLVASGGMDDTVKVWDVTTRAEVVSFSNRGERTYSVAFHPKKPILAAVSEDKMLRFWDLEKKNRISATKLDLYLGLQLSSDGASIATKELGKDTMKVWNVEIKE